MATTCQALSASDKQQCTQQATSFSGYKKRNARLDALDAASPDYLLDKKLHSVDFGDVKDEDLLDKLHKYLFARFNLIDAVVKARKFHNVHFYASDLDYGHKTIIDKLTNERFVSLQALERLERRAVGVLYAQRKWFKWVRQQQEDEEAVRDNEVKKIKKEAQLFVRYRKQVDARMARKRRQEERRMQDLFLEQAYQERQLIDDEDYDSEWDPIDEDIEDERLKFIDLMKHLLWIAEEGPDKNQLPQRAENIDDATKQAATETETIASNSQAVSKPLNRNQKKRAKKQVKDVEARPSQGGAAATPVVAVNETPQQLRQRLVDGEEYNWRQGWKGTGGGQIAGTIEHPVALHGKILGLPQEEAEQLVCDIREIKQLLLCRLLISQAALLPAAMRAASLDDFFQDPEITAPDLRDLCLRLERPSLQEIRDACADFARCDAEESDEHVTDADDEQETLDRELDQRHAYRACYDAQYWKSKAGEDPAATRETSDEPQTHVDFGDIADDGDFKQTKMRIKICGRSIWNYASERSLPRGGWLHFSVIAKGTSLGDAVQLCRHWDEFWELNILTLYGYFPSSSWGAWASDRSRTQFLQLGFIQRYIFNNAHSTSTRLTGRLTVATEYRNFMVAHIKRNDPVSRRFVQYLMLQASTLCVLVRDAKTGRVLVKPPKEHLWLVRETRPGSAPKVTVEVSEAQFEKLSDSIYSSFRFSFPEHYDVIIWDLEPARRYDRMELAVQTALLKANRYTEGSQCYDRAESIIRTLHRERDTMRCRDVREGEDSIWDDLHGPDASFIHKVQEDGISRDMTPEEIAERYYNETDANEDMMLFPEEAEGKVLTAITGHADRITREMEESGPNMTRFVKNLDTDDDSDDHRNVKAKLTNGKSRKTLEGKAKTQSLALMKQKNATFNRENSGSQLVNRTERFLDAKNQQSLTKARGEANAREHQWDKDERTCPNDFAEGCECAVCWTFAGPSTVASKLQQLDLVRDDAEEEWEDDDEEDDSTDDEIYEEDLEAVEHDSRQLKLLKKFAFSPGPRREDVEKQFFIFVEREKAKAFKPQWHAADLEPGARERWAELQNLMVVSQLINSRSRLIRGQYVKALFWLDVHPSEHRLVFRDIMSVFAYVGMFFSGEQYGEDVAVWRTTLPDRTSLFDTEFKRRQLPYFRDWRSLQLRPSEFWPARNTIKPGQYDGLTRPILAHLYKAGIIAPMHESDVPGRAIGREDPMTGREEMYIDYRAHGSGPSERDLKHITDWTKIDLLDIASKYAKEHSDARFALLRVWSHSHFWPLTMGIEKRLDWSFSDSIGRSWYWKFYPKDAYALEWSVQHTIDLRFKRWLPQLGRNVTVKRDLVLVMGKDELELEKMMVGAVFVLQTNPWRLEVDFWRSFVNVGEDFLRGLDRGWVE